MSAEPVPQPLAPVIRFRIRTMLVVTAIFAIAAAIGGIYYRQVSPAGQNNLFILWTTITLLTAGSFWLRLRASFQRGQSRNIQHVVYSPHGKYFGSRRSLFYLWITFTLGYLLLASWLAGKVDDYALGPMLNQGLTLGLCISGCVFTIVRRPVYLCDDGIPLAANYVAPWKFIRHAEWIIDRPGIMKLRRFDGDIYIDVPARERNAVEAFIRTKTKFIGAAPTPELQPTP